MEEELLQNGIGMGRGFEMIEFSRLTLIKVKFKLELIGIVELLFKDQN